MSAWTCRHSDGKADQKIGPPVLESHDGRALVPIPERSTSPWETSTLQRWVDSLGSLKALDPNRPIREADILKGWPDVG
jgi:hypothetical protein